MSGEYGLLYLETGAREDGGARKKFSRTGDETISTWGSSASRGARDGAREQLDENTVRASSLVSAGSWSKSSSLSSHFGGGDMKADEKGTIGDNIRGEGGGEDFLRYFNGTVLMGVVGERAFVVDSPPQSTGLDSHHVSHQTRPMMSRVPLIRIYPSYKPYPFVIHLPK